MSKVWVNAGKVVTNASGQPIVCATCPCGCTLIDVGDSYSGTGDDSAALSDTNWNCRYDDTNPLTGLSIVSGTLRWNVAAGTVVSSAATHYTPDGMSHSGEFYCGVNVTAWSTTTAPGSGQQERVLYYVVLEDGTTYYGGWNWTNSTKNNVWRTPGFGFATVTHNLTGQILITRNASNQIKVFLRGVQVGSTSTNSSPVDWVGLVWYTTASRAITIDVSDTFATDLASGAGSNIQMCCGGGT